MADKGKLEILGVAIHTIDKFARLPLWRYSMPFAYLKAYLSRFPEYAEVAIDANNYYQNQPLHEILAAVSAARPRIVLFSAYVWNYLAYATLARRIEQADPDTVIVLGGPEVAEDMEDILRSNPDFDILVSGEGEEAFHQWLLPLSQHGPTREVRRPGSGLHRSPSSQGSRDSTALHHGPYLQQRS